MHSCEMRKFMRHLLYILLVAIFGVIAVPASAQVSLPGPSQAAQIPGAGTTQPAPLVSHMPAAGTGAGITDFNYRLGTGDKMKITVQQMRHQSLSLERAERCGCLRSTHPEVLRVRTSV